MISTIFGFSLALATIPLPIPLFPEGALLTGKVTYTHVMILIAFPPTKTLLVSMSYYIITGATLYLKGLARVVIFTGRVIRSYVLFPH
tara:strand:+ start:243 stop:506 length:264 start_codon:yes stop_codon:yes gene_type:complete